MIPNAKPTNYKFLGSCHSLHASNMTKNTLFNSTNAPTGPAGPLEYAFCTQALPIESKIDPNMPMTNKSFLKVSTSFQYQVTPTIITMILVKQLEAKLTVIASKPTLGDVRCLINKPEATKKQGVRNPNSTGIHFGSYASGSTIKGESIL